ncbi:MAG: hypothetical protein JST82_00625 [Bacteroidetes bacterium]|nr:hypothetical protein [Bacteroidota bacterium]
MKKTIVIVLSLLVVLGSCKKKSSDAPRVSFNNRLDKQVTLSVYASMTDYANGTNAVLRKSVKAGEIASFEDVKFTAGKTYYMDWFTDDFYRNNWYNDAYPEPGTRVAFTPATGDNSYYLDPSFAGNSRMVFLADNDVSSSWHAINAYMYSASTGYVSFWSSLSESDRFKQVKVYKGFNADFNYKDATGKLANSSLNFKVQHSQNGYIEFMGADGKSLGYMMSGMLPTGAAPDYYSAAKDTVMALLPNSDYYYMMIRD